MGKSYQCNMCGRHIIAPTTNEVLAKVKAHGTQKHQITAFSDTQLTAIKRKIENYMDS